MSGWTGGTRSATSFNLDAHEIPCLNGTTKDMIRITVDMWPQGDQRKAYRLAALDIINDGTNAVPSTRGNYVTRFFARNGRLTTRTSSTVDWPRTRKPVLSLVRHMLEQAGY